MNVPGQPDTPYQRDFNTLEGVYAEVQDLLSPCSKTLHQSLMVEDRNSYMVCYDQHKNKYSDFEECLRESAKRQNLLKDKFQNYQLFSAHWLQACLQKSGP